MKSLLTLHCLVLQDVGRLCSTEVTRDVSYITGRFENEGDSFLAITLPTFAKALERALDEGSWPRHELLGFKKSGSLPAFMRGFLTRIFDKHGQLLAHPDADSIWAVRQVCYLTSKIERECSPARVDTAFTQFLATDKELEGLQDRIDPGRLEAFVRRSDLLFGEMWDHLETKVASYELAPKHGPGAVADRLNQMKRRDLPYWTERLEEVFPFWRYSRNTGYATHPTVVPQNSELPVRVITVPKTQATPRIIAIEPSAMQYAQQGLKNEIYDFVSASRLNNVIGFRDQTRNQSMALVASQSGELATLDLSEASDRVHAFLISAMLHRHPHLREFVEATRSQSAMLPDGSITRLNKFASMGSALTFPFEAIVFYTLTSLGVSECTGRVETTAMLESRVSVYGDDIIAPVDSVAYVIDWLEHFGAKVNRSKSFWNGKFRETCGAEFYDGHNVAVTRVRHDLPRSRRDAAKIGQMVDFRNRAFLAGLWSTSRHLDEELDNFIRLDYTSVHHEGRLADGSQTKVTSLGSSHRRLRFNPHLQRFEYLATLIRPKGTEYVPDGESGLLEWFHGTLHREDPVESYRRKERATSFNIQRRWLDAHLSFEGV